MRLQVEKALIFVGMVMFFSIEVVHGKNHLSLLKRVKLQPIGCWWSLLRIVA